MTRLAACWSLLAGCCLVPASDIPPPRPLDIAALVRQLESEDEGERKRALERLMALPVTEPPAELLAGLKSDNPVIRAGVKKAAQAIRARVALPTLPRGKKFAERGEIDLFVAATATWDLAPDDERLWVPPFEVGARAIGFAGLTEDRRPHGAPTFFRDFPTYRSKLSPRFIRTDTVYSQPEKDDAGRPTLGWREAIQAAGVDNPKALSGLVVSRGSVSAKSPMNESLILATGNVTAGNDMNDSVVICDGDVQVTKDARCCLIIARGKITVGGSATTCYLIAGGSVDVAKPLSRVQGLETAIVEKEPQPLDFIKFFELKRVGLEVKATDGVVRVAGVGKPSEIAGVKVGDTILDVNGKKPTDAESLRRLLRDTLGVGDATIKLKRGNETLTVKLSLPE